MHIICGASNSWQVVVATASVVQLPGQKNKASTLWLVICMLNQMEIGSELGTHKWDGQ